MTDVLDFEAAMDRVDNDTELYFELYEMFCSEYETQASELRSAVNQKAYTKVESKAHALKSALGNLGAMVSYEAAATLEKAGKESVSEELDSKLSHLLNSINDFQAAVEAKKSQ